MKYTIIILALFGGMGLTYICILYLPGLIDNLRHQFAINPNLFITILSFTFLVVAGVLWAVRDDRLNPGGGE